MYKAALFALASVLVACSSPDDAPDPGGEGGGETQPEPTPEPTCAAPEPAHLQEVFRVDIATATLIGTDGAPAAGVTSKVCGTDVCSDILQTEPNGSTTVNASMELTDPRFVYGKGKSYAEMAVVLTASDPNPVLGEIHAIKLPSFSDGAAFAPGDVTQNGVTLSIADDAVFDHDTLLFGDPTEQVFRANAVAVAGYTFPAIDPALGLEMLVALGPNNTVICPAAGLTVPNEAGWSPGTAVDVYVHGHLTFRHYAPYGQWSPIAEAVVSDDGATIRTVEGDGVELLAVYGFAAR